MAIGGGDGSIVLNTKIDDGGIKKGLASIGKLVAAAFAVKQVAAFGKALISSYADYEQLVGGVETLFKKSSKQLIEYANQAYKTTGQSANEYMKNVTAFSASLLSAVGGDTEKAADVANAAMISISDNVNKMGSSVESVQMAFQGFAKQQYMLLDNLKLGYGGTKTEMERLLRDAEAYRASIGETVNYDINNLADVYTAIGDIQEKLGIAGTTAKEASTTISGSAATMKAAWQNVMVAISGGGDLDVAIENLVDAISTYFDNIVPVVERSLAGVGKLIEKIAPKLVQTVARSLIAAIPSLLSAVYEMIIGLAKGIYQGIIDLFSGTAVESTNDVLEEQAANIEQSVENQNELTDAVNETADATKRALAGFDDIQTISFGENDTAGTDLGSASVGADDAIDALGNTVDAIGDAEKEVSRFDAFFNNFAKRLKPVIGLLSAAFNVLTAVFKPFEPVAIFLIENFIKPFADATTNLAISAMEWLTDVLNDFADWARENPKAIQTAAGIILGFIGGIYIYLHKGAIVTALMGIVTAFKNMHALFQLMASEGVIKTITTLFGGLNTQLILAGAAVGVLVGGIVALSANWDKLTPANRAITILSALAAAATAAAVAIALFHTSWTVGVAAAAIAGGLALLGLSFGLAGKSGTKARTSDEAAAFYNSNDFSKGYKIPALAKGAVIPPNREFLAVLGDQRKGTNIETPLSTMVQAFQMALDSRGGMGSTEVVLELNGRELGRAIVEQGDRERRRIGTRLVIG